MAIRSTQHKDTAITIITINGNNNMDLIMEITDNGVDTIAAAIIKNKDI